MIKPDEKLIDTIINAIDWDEVYDPNRNFSEDDPSAIVESLPIDIEVYTGASKCVLAPKHKNFVIKLPFLYCSRGAEELIELENAPFSGNDYCYSEWQYFILAHDANVAMFFPDTIQYCTLPYHIYLQEKCTPINCFRNQKLTQEEQDLLLPFKALTKKFNHQWILACYKHYGGDALCRLHQFLIKYDISDFHGDNYGYRISDNSPVLIDFSGFNY